MKKVKCNCCGFEVEEKKAIRSFDCVTGKVRIDCDKCFGKVESCTKK